MRQKRREVGVKGPKIRARKISLRLTIVSETSARVAIAIFENFSSVFQFKSDNLNVS